MNPTTAIKEDLTKALAENGAIYCPEILEGIAKQSLQAKAELHQLFGLTAENEFRREIPIEMEIPQPIFNLLHTFARILGGTLSADFRYIYAGKQKIRTSAALKKELPRMINDYPLIRGMLLNIQHTLDIRAISSNRGGEILSLRSRFIKELFEYLAAAGRNRIYLSANPIDYALCSENLEGGLTTCYALGGQFRFAWTSLARDSYTLMIIFGRREGLSFKKTGRLWAHCFPERGILLPAAYGYLPDSLFDDIYKWLSERLLKGASTIEIRGEEIDGILGYIPPDPNGIYPDIIHHDDETCAIISTAAWQTYETGRDTNSSFINFAAETAICPNCGKPQDDRKAILQDKITAAGARGEDTRALSTALAFWDTSRGICLDCALKYYALCKTCGKILRKDAMALIYDGYFCPACAEAERAIWNRINSKIAWEAEAEAEDNIEEIILLDDGLLDEL